MIPPFTIATTHDNGFPVFEPFIYRHAAARIFPQHDKRANEYYCTPVFMLRELRAADLGVLKIVVENQFKKYVEVLRRVADQLDTDDRRARRLFRKRVVKIGTMNREGKKPRDVLQYQIYIDGTDFLFACLNDWKAETISVVAGFTSHCGALRVEGETELQTIMHIAFLITTGHMKPDIENQYFLT